jgi:hypothetical protein
MRYYFINPDGSINLAQGSLIVAIYNETDQIPLTKEVTTSS